METHLCTGYVSGSGVSYVDAQIGRLLDELDAQDIRDDTIVVLWSDHGYKLGDLGSWAKHTNFELDTRVPLIVSAPGLPKGKRCNALVELVDLHPTLSELAGLPVHSGAEGESFAANVVDPKAPGQEAAFSQFPRGGFMGHSVRTDRHRYTEWSKTHENGDREVAAIELYDYQDSPYEQINLANQPEHANLQQELQHLLHQQILPNNQSPSAKKK